MKSQCINPHQNRIMKAHYLTKLPVLTNWSNNESNNTIQHRNFNGNQITKENGMSFAWSQPLIWLEMKWIPLAGSIMVSSAAVHVRAFNHTLIYPLGHNPWRNLFKQHYLPAFFKYAIPPSCPPYFSSCPMFAVSCLRSQGPLNQHWFNYMSWKCLHYVEAFPVLRRIARNQIYSRVRKMLTD